MWTEIKLSALQNQDVSAIREARKFIASQSLMNEYYETKLTREYLQSMLERKAALSLGLYNYEDDDIFATLAVKKNQDGTVRLLTTSCGKGDIEKAADIVQAALIKGMTRLGVTSCYALWGASNYEAGTLYYNKFVERCSLNFATSSNTEYSPGKYRLEMIL